MREQDSPGTLLSQIVWSLAGSTLFTIDSDTGLITTTAALDRSVQAEYQLTATARNPVEGPSSSATVAVSVRERNQFGPEFELAIFAITRREVSGADAPAAR